MVHLFCEQHASATWMVCGELCETGPCLMRSMGTARALSTGQRGEAPQAASRPKARVGVMEKDRSWQHPFAHRGLLRLPPPPPPQTRQALTHLILAAIQRRTAPTKSRALNNKSKTCTGDCNVFATGARRPSQLDLAWHALAPAARPGAVPDCCYALRITMGQVG